VRGGGLGLGRILGIRILIHPSWFVIFALVVFSLATLGAPAGDGAALSAPARWVVAFIVALLFFASVLVHELAHALVARRRGVQVSEITLFIFGGAANLEQDAPDPRTEAVISAAGPLASILLGGIFLGAWFVTRGADVEVLQAFSGISFWLGVSNLMLAVFNLIPGFPMDGGRLLRSLIWSVTKDFVRATRVATLVGRAFAYGLIALGFVIALNGGGVDSVINGIWLAFIGWFLNQAAESSYRRVEFERLVEGIRVRDVMDREVPTIGPNLTIDTLVDQHFLTGEASLYPVTMDGDLMGTIEIGQVSRIPRTNWPVTRVTDVMSRGGALVTLTEPQTLMDAVSRFEESGLSAIPVVDGEDARRLVGIVTRDGLFRAIKHRAALRA
jgi:Zn-dependent protease/predicted transcriptional regulator